MSVVIDAFSRWYFGKLTERLGRLGMTYHDAIAETGIYYKAIGRLPGDMQESRQRRMKRAQDLSQKHVDIPAEMREDPWREYSQVKEVFAETQKEVDERKHMNNQYWLPFHIGRETWHAYDTKKAWFWSSGQKKITK